MAHEQRTGVRRISGDEYDALGRSKRFFRWRPGERKAIKTRYNRRVRRPGKIEGADD